MTTNYTELKQDVSSNLLGVGLSPGSQSKQSRLMLVQHSDFLEIPVAAKIQLHFVSFSKLEAGDFIAVTCDSGTNIRRFLSVSFNEGCTRLIVVDADGFREEVSFTRLLGRVDRVHQGDTSFDPNPTNFLQRAGFRLLQTFSKNKPAA